MMTAVISPTDGTTAGQRSYTLPACAPGILDKLQLAAQAIDAAQQAGKGRLKLTFNIHGKSTVVEVVSLIE